MSKKTKQKNTAIQKVVPTVVGTALVATSVYSVTCFRFFQRIFSRRFIPALKLQEGTSFFNEYKTYHEWLESQNYSTETIHSFDNLALYATSIPAAHETHQWVICVPGYGQSGVDRLETPYQFHEEGYNVLTIDSRACGQSEGQLLTMGILEKKDLLDWIRWVLNRDNEAEIILYGVSFGASTVMMATGELLPEGVKAAICDCGYTSVNDIIRYQIQKDFGMSGKPFLFGINLIAKTLGKFDMNDGNMLDALSRSHTPTLFIHGEKDDFVPCEMVFENYYACSAEKELYTVQNARHASSNRNPNYYARVNRFCSRYL